MTPVTLYHVDPSINMSRFYYMDIQPDLFGHQSLVRVWGRIGRGGQMRIIPYKNEQEAENAFDKLLTAKRRKGYTDEKWQ